MRKGEANNENKISGKSGFKKSVIETLFINHWQFNLYFINLANQLKLIEL
jgi:hypothetical protein